MGSFHSPSPESPLSRYRVYLPFCSKEPNSNTLSSNWIECYNPVDNSWSYVTPIEGLIDNHILKGFAMTSVGESIYIIGGRFCRKERRRAYVSDQLEEYFEANVEVISSVMRYDIFSNKWFKCASLITPRYDFACTVSNNKIYVAGGLSTLASARGVSSAEVYDPSVDKWTPLQNMSTQRYKCVGVTWQGKIHVVGGFVERGESDKVVHYVDRSTTEVYDEETGKWDLLVGMWQLDVPPNQIVDVGGTLFSSGDCLNAWKGHIEAYDGKLNLWFVVERSHLQIHSIPMSTSYDGEESWCSIGRFYLTMAPIGNRLYFLGGNQMDGESSRTRSTVHVFDTSAAEGAWKSLEPIEKEGEKELCSHCCVVQLPYKLKN